MSVSVAQRLARLSQQYPFHAPQHFIHHRPIIHRRCLAHQAFASRKTELSQAANKTASQRSTDTAHADSADSTVASPTTLVTPLLGSILNFIQRRAQITKQSTSATSAHASPSPNASLTATAHSSLPTPLAASPTTPAIDLYDPAISLLFPRLPLPPPPPARLQPPFPTPPSAARTTRQYDEWYSSLPHRTQLHVLLLQAATSDHTFVRKLTRLLNTTHTTSRTLWQDQLSEVSRRRMAAVKRRVKREDELLELLYKKECTKEEWTRLQDDRALLEAEHACLYWQKRWLTYDTKLRASDSESGATEERKVCKYECTRAETEMRVRLRVLGMRDSTIDTRIAELMSDARHGRQTELRWKGKSAIKLREREVSEWKERTVRAMYDEHTKWTLAYTRTQQKRQVERKQQRHSIATQLRPIDWSNPPTSLDDLLASFHYRNSERFKLEVWRHRWYTTEMARRALDSQQPLTEISLQRQHGRFYMKQRAETTLLKRVEHEHRSNERRKRNMIRSLVSAYLSPINPPLTGWHIYQLLRLVVAERQLVGLSAALPVATSEEVFNASLGGASVPPSPLPASIAVTPFSQPYMWSYTSATTARASSPVVRVRDEEDSSGGSHIVIEVRNARRDAVVWMYEAMRDARTPAHSSGGVIWSEVVRVGTDGESDMDSGELDAVSGGSDEGGEHGWCVLDMGDVVVQTHSEDDTSGVTARRWLSVEEAKMRLSAVSLTRFNIITAAA